MLCHVIIGETLDKVLTKFCCGGYCIKWPNLSQFFNWCHSGIVYISRASIRAYERLYSPILLCHSSRLLLLFYTV